MGCPLTSWVSPLTHRGGKEDPLPCIAKGKMIEDEAPFFDKLGLSACVHATAQHPGTVRIPVRGRI